MLLGYLLIILNSGYMSPEYAMRGAFSIKSDTYSFGVLEIVSGLKIRSPQLIANFSSLITYAWILWEDEKASELVDPSVLQAAHFMKFYGVFMWDSCVFKIIPMIGH